MFIYNLELPYLCLVFQLPLNTALKNKLYGDFSWIEFNFFKATEPVKRNSVLLTAKYPGIASTQYS